MHRISSWCLTSTDSATTERPPRRPASRATITSRCRKRRSDRAVPRPRGIASRARNAQQFAIRDPQVRGLTLDDIDWERERIHPPRPKQRRVGEYPLVREVGEAILRYTTSVRPRCASRALFVTLRHPYRPLSDTGLGTMARALRRTVSSATRAGARARRARPCPCLRPPGVRRCRPCRTPRWPAPSCGPSDRRSA
jgi:integrase